ncbi:ABC-F family ATP-binding cassette domain-containing protein [Mobilitalea sibirica]|uniref:ABC-F family ATP-binding cassette domain-containing protein n=1 Tax=Mobilitalea sibirica TaxID=1462919 RepID=A0A8J7H094_9FIRM|nr:ABC-F family ATP-binding cassette domain-containing protein [Mobilitalea sibirica]MBH1939434.1 ABC-F family ATP-binding cassette domain-containing protein [Mobilitalea sibirica]
MIELSVHNLKKYYGANQIFENISFDIKTGERVGFIGQNGCGKTTVMKILMGLEDYQEGDINIRKDAKLGYLNQIPDYEEAMLTIEVLQTAFGHVYQMKKEMKKLEEQFLKLEGEALNKALQQYGRVTEQYELSGGYDLETNINKICEGLNINETMKGMPFYLLSGGEKTRVILAKILLEEPDILLLDEPSNHLDLVSIEWLESFLRDYKGAVLVISHDRYFLDAVVSKIIELDYDHADVYPGNYSYYVVEKERRFLVDYKHYQNEQRKIDRIEKQIQRYRIWGDSRDSEVMYKRAKELEKRLEKIDTPKKPILNKRKIRLNQNTTQRTGKIVLEALGLKKSFDQKEILKEVDITLFYQDSACIIGKNGSGKSTLLKALLGELKADHGNVRFGSGVIVGYLPQQVEYEDEDLTVLEYFSRLHNISNGEARSQLAKVLFMKEDVNKKIRFLSGGEKSRLKLCSLTFEGVNFLILDEPTNHLDIDSREVLEETLSEFDGTLLFVSHDRYFINKVADKMVTLEDGSIIVYHGDYTYYQEEYQKALVRTTEGASDNLSENRNTMIKPDSKDLSDRPTSDRHNRINVQHNKDNSKKKLEQLEIEIEEQEEKIKALEELMNLYSYDGDRLNEIYKDKEQLDHKLFGLYREWEELQ